LCCTCLGALLGSGMRAASTATHWAVRQQAAPALSEHASHATRSRALLGSSRARRLTA
jgi:hypothetical protein